MSAQQIADRLGLSRRTVEVHKSHVFEKLDIDSTADLVKYAYEAGLVGKK
jgi:DNA-binding CsgD family transcriptional regulator